MIVAFKGGNKFYMKNDDKASISLKKSLKPFVTQARSPLTFQEINFIFLPHFDILQSNYTID